MNIVHITDTNTAYVPARLVRLINEYTDHHADLLQAKRFIFGNPLNVPVERELEPILEILRNADVIHYHGNTIHDRRKFLGIRLNDYILEKPYVLHYHGSPQRENYMRCRRAVPMLVSTPEMLPLFPGARYFPNLLDETHEIYTRRNTPPKGTPLRICHSFSYHIRLKNTGFFKRAQAHYESNGNEMLFGYLDQLQFDELLRARAEYDICFDHLQGYYGCISIESMAQGVAAMNGVDTDTQRALVDFFGSMPPFMVVPDNAKNSFDGFLSYLKTIDRATVEDHAQRGREYMETTWSGQKNIHRLIEIYEGLSC